MRSINRLVEALNAMLRVVPQVQIYKFYSKYYLTFDRYACKLVLDRTVKYETNI
jgi:hypothetical protein